MNKKLLKSIFVVTLGLQVGVKAAEFISDDESFKSFDSELDVHFELENNQLYKVPYSVYECFYALVDKLGTLKGTSESEALFLGGEKDPIEYPAKIDTFRRLSILIEFLNGKYQDKHNTLNEDIDVIMYGSLTPKETLIHLWDIAVLADDLNTQILDVEGEPKELSFLLAKKIADLLKIEKLNQKEEPLVTKSVVVHNRKQYESPVKNVISAKQNFKGAKRLVSSMESLSFTKQVADRSVVKSELPVMVKNTAKKRKQSIIVEPVNLEEETKRLDSIQRSCFFCSKLFSTLEERKQHFEEVHSNAQ